MSDLPKTCLPTWTVGDLPEPKKLGLRNIAGFIGPGIVMCGIQIAGGEWLLGAEITARYGGGLMWLAAVAIVGQVFYNMECGRYALYTGEPVFTGFMRARPGPPFWIGVLFLLSMGSLIPGLSTQAAAVLSAIFLDRVPGEADRALVTTLAFVLLGVVSLPILVGGKIYNMMQAVMTVKVFVVLGFCLIMGVLFVSPNNWGDVFSGFLKVGNVPVVAGEDRNGNGVLDPGEDFDRDGRLDVVEPVKARDRSGRVVAFDDLDGDGKWDGENVENLFLARFRDGEWPVLLLTQIALLGAFIGYAGGGGLGNATYSNYCRDKGWGMGGQVGAIPSAIGGRKVTLSHIGKVFAVSEENLRRWKGWWRTIVVDQCFIWGSRLRHGDGLAGAPLDAVLPELGAVPRYRGPRLGAGHHFRRRGSPFRHVQPVDAGGSVDRHADRRAAGAAAEPDVDRRGRVPPLDRHLLVEQPPHP